MRRLMIVIPIALAFAAGWTLASERGTTADAQARKAKPLACKDELARTKRDLASATADNAKMRVTLETVYAKERERVEALEEQLGGTAEPIRDLK
jgi:hypothetical protein